MILKSFQDVKLSALGFGAMRLPITSGDFVQIDEAATTEMIDYAMEHGVNYYDTAWGYHNGNSETVTSRGLRRYPRESYYFATKFPGYNLSNMEKVEEIFEKQLEKCALDYFDFYLFHNVCEMNIDAYLDPKYGIFDYLMRQKRSGRIKHLGFSAHGEYSVMKSFLDTYGKDMEFCQIQLNWLDWSFQGARAKVELLNEWRIPIWAMEPLRGGRLAALSEADTAKLRMLRSNESTPAWAFRFLQGIPNVKVTLSGMSNLSQLKENIATYEDERPLNEQETNNLFEIAGEMAKGVPCTACRYCTSHCPQNLDIPMLINLYNEHNFTDGGFIVPMALMAVPADRHPSACIACKSCEAICPQRIEVSKVLSDFSVKLKR